ncbi:MAG: hypothetical protein WC747_02040 [Candidatus Babeliales bacterium]|jgi:hypothetical protein
MNQILSLWLSEQEQLNIISPVSTLETIVCCDKVSLVFHVQGQTVVIKNSVAVCELDNLRKGFELILNKDQQLFSFLDCVALYGDFFGNFSIEIRYQNQIFFKKTISAQALKSWIAQLELLHVLAEENEKEKQSRGRGCC